MEYECDEKELTVLKMYEITSLMEVGRKSADVSNSGNEWRL